MNRFLLMLLMLLVALLVGCSGIKPQGTKVTEAPDGTTTTEYGPGEFNEQQQLQAQQECRQWWSEQDDKAYQAIAAAPQDQQGILIMGVQMGSSMRAMAWGGKDPCRPGTNVWDYYIAEVRSKNHAVEVVGGGAVDMVGGAIPYGAVTWVADKALNRPTGDTYNQNGENGKQTVAKSEINGQGNSGAQEVATEKEFTQTAAEGAAPTGSQDAPTGQPSVSDDDTSTDDHSQHSGEDGNNLQ